MVLLYFSQKMENSYLSEIRKYYGSEVEEYFKNKNIIPRKVGCGALKIKNLSDIINCEQIIQDKQLYNEMNKMYLLKPKNRKSNSRNKDSVTNKQLKSMQYNPFLKEINIKIILHENSSKISANCPPQKCILDKAATGFRIYNDILKTKVRICGIENYDGLKPSEQLISILEQFRKNHNKNSYKCILSNILNITNPNKSRGTSREVLQKSQLNIYDLEITAKQLSTFFTQILIKHVPIQLFGCCKNREIVTRIVCCILRSMRFQPIYLKPYINQLKIEEITWLKSFKDEFAKWLIITKLVKWLILKYVIRILYKYIHVTEHPTAVGKRLYIERLMWDGIKTLFVKNNSESKIFVPVVTQRYDVWSPPKCEFKLLLKVSGIRPIIKARYTEDDMPVMRMLLKFLRQLCITHYGLISPLDFRNKWKNIVHERSSESKCNKKWIVSCDIHDAYGSILLDQLNNIIKILCKDLPKKLKLKWIASLHNKCNNAEVVYQRYFVDLEVAIPTGTIYTTTSTAIDNCKCHIVKSTLLEWIEKCILYQKVQVRKEEFILGKGILQGTMLSNILSDIYYSYVTHQRLSTYMKSGILFRYVDDILYLTENKKSAMDFMKTINQGFIEYNCTFKQSKIQTNLPNEDNSIKKKIKYLGYTIDCNSLETVPYFQNAHPSCLFTLALKNRRRYESIKIFQSRLHNFSHLKLSNIILKDPVNFVKHLMYLARKMATMNAWRSFMLIRKLFKDIQKYNENIYETIAKSNKYIVQSLLKLYKPNIRKKVKISVNNMKRLLIMLFWIGYKKVFSKDETLREIFMPKIQRNIKILNK